MKQMKPYCLGHYFQVIDEGPPLVGGVVVCLMCKYREECLGMSDEAEREKGDAR